MSLKRICVKPIWPQSHFPHSPGFSDACSKNDSPDPCQSGRTVIGGFTFLIVISLPRKTRALCRELSKSPAASFAGHLVGRFFAGAWSPITSRSSTSPYRNPPASRCSPLGRPGCCCVADRKCNRPRRALCRPVEVRWYFHGVVSRRAGSGLPGDGSFRPVGTGVHQSHRRPQRRVWIERSQSAARAAAILSRALSVSRFIGPGPTWLPSASARPRTSCRNRPVDNNPSAGRCAARSCNR